MTHTLRRVDAGDETLTEPVFLVGFDDDLAGEATRTSSRIRGLPTSFHPALERVVGPRVAHLAALEILSRCGGPECIRNMGRRKLTAIATKHAPPMGARQVEEILAAVPAQTATVPAAETGLPKLAQCPVSGSGPEPASCSKSATAPASPPPATLPFKRVSRQSPTGAAAPYAATSSPDPATTNSNAPCSSPPSPHCTTPPAAATTGENSSTKILQ